MKKLYMVMDTETTTHEWASELAGGNENARKRLAIMNPIVYDIGWVITDRRGHIQKRASYLVEEIFFNAPVFAQAYYVDRRPRYLQSIINNEIEVRGWDYIMRQFISDLKTVNYVGAYNTLFDQRAIQYTDTYIHKLESGEQMFSRWNNSRREFCKKILCSKIKEQENPDFDFMHFNFRGAAYPNFDIWNMACKRLLGIRYKTLCLKKGWLSNSGEYFSTSAETVYRYLNAAHDFNEDHTALADAEIETSILIAALHNKSIEQGIAPFPFRLLGSPREYIASRRQAATVVSTMENYILTAPPNSTYAAQVSNHLKEIERKYDL